MNSSSALSGASNAHKDFGADFQVTRFVFSLEAYETLILPGHNKGNVLRGAFGSVFKQICCGSACSNCSASPLRDQCAYASIFEPAPPRHSERLSTFQDIPRPFVFRPPADVKNRYERGDLFEFELLLFGSALQYLPYFIVAFRELSERGFGIGRGRCTLKSVMALGAGTDCPVAEVYTHESQSVRAPASTLQAADIMQVAPTAARRIQVEYLTPTHIKHQGGTVETPEFHHLIKRLRDRINALACFYCGTVLDVDFAEFGRRAESVKTDEVKIRWVSRERFSTRTKQTHPIGGFVGEAIYSGDIAEFVPLLRLGEWVHVGKHAVWGNGRYKVALMD